MKKISIIGDIMVEPPFLEQVTTQQSGDFYPSFAPMKVLFEGSDYVIGNLETPLAGEAAGYTAELVSFNSPDCLADALKKLGIDAVSTCNNHALDRGYEGLARTIDVLEEKGISHTGTYKEDFTGDKNLYFTVGDTVFALVAYTSSTNYGINKVLLEDARAHCVNKLRTLNAGSMATPLPPAFADTKKYIAELLGREMTWEEGIKLKKSMHLPVAFADEHFSEADMDTHFAAVAEDYRRAREKADLVLFYPHAGGQFNVTPGAFTATVCQKAAKLGFDAVLAAHSHTTQKAEFVAGAPCFYSLGNVTMSPGTSYSVRESLPEYGLAVHLYVEDKNIAKVTFSIFKMVEENGEPLRVVPADVLYETLSGTAQAALLQDVAAVYERVAGKPFAALQQEYELG